MPPRIPRQHHPRLHTRPAGVVRATVVAPAAALVLRLAVLGGLLAAVAVPRAHAAPAEEASDRDLQTREAEHARLSDEMERLSQRQIWEGVDKTFRKLVRLEVKLTEKDYLTGAFAARELGRVLQVRERLQEAARIHGTREIVDWLWDIDNHYGRVELVSVPARSSTLEAKVMPFDPNQRKAVEHAMRSVQDDGLFVGMLPKGEYTFSGQPFTVEAGIDVRIEVSPRMRRQGIIEPVYVRPDRPGMPQTSSTEPQPPEPAPSGSPEK